MKMRKRSWRPAGEYLIIALLFICSICTQAVTVSAQKAQSVQSLDAKVSDYIKKTMTEQHIAGATLVVVKDGEVVLKKGYGYADVENNKTVDPDQTLFRIGSVTKLFTAVAAMQQVESGKMALDVDINSYLKDLKVVNPYETPLTLACLLTQTGGFAESVDGIYSQSLTPQPKPLSRTLAEHLPPIIRRPGEVVQYSNYGYSLIGHLVEQVSGEPFNQYVTDHIFKLLDMNKAAYFLSPDLLDHMSKSYVYKNEHFESKPLGSILVHPAGSIAATGDDMGKFLLAILQNGQVGEGRILKEKTAQIMRARHFTVQDSMPGYGYGFYEHYKNTDIVLHDGDADTFTSQLSLYPKENLGYFISYNTLDDGVLREGLENVMYSHYNVSLDPLMQFETLNTAQPTNDEKFDGSYVFAQRLLDGPLKSRGLFLKVNIKSDKEGNVHVQAFDSRVGGIYRPAGEHLYVNPENGRRIFLKEDPDGKQFVIVNMNVPLQTLEKLSAMEVFMESFVRPFVFGFAVLGILFEATQLFRRKKRRILKGAALLARRTSKCLSVMTGLLGIAILMVMFTESDDIRRGVQIILIAISITIALSISALLTSLIKGLISRQLSFWNWSCYTLVVLSACGALMYASFLDMYKIW